MNKKISRNSLCPCGSGRKYKKCCMNKSKQSEQSNTLLLSDIFKVQELMLQSYIEKTYQDYRTTVVDVKPMGTETILCELQTTCIDSINLKNMVFDIMSFVFPAFADDKQIPITPKRFAVRLIDNESHEIMYAFSSDKTLRNCKGGYSIEWLKNTSFEENTPHSRLLEAKVKNAEIEKGLRKLIATILFDHFKEDWWEKAVSVEIRNKVLEIFKFKYGEDCIDGEILLDYTYILQINTIIKDNWLLFQKIFSSKTSFSKNINALNSIRKDEAHNREISHESIDRLREIYDYFLESIAKLFPDIIPNYILENWHRECSVILEKTKVPHDYFTSVKHNPTEFFRRHEAYIFKLKNCEVLLKSVLVPVNKKALHHGAIHCIAEIRESIENMTNAGKVGDFDNVVLYSKENEKANKKLQDITKQILISQ